jgi:hypothetical protein
MLLKPNTDVQPGTIVTPDGTIANRPTVMLTDDEAKLLRAYKKFLEHHGLREALFCNTCWNLEIHDGLEAYVLGHKIGLICRCTTRLHFGYTY